MAPDKIPQTGDKIPYIFTAIFAIIIGFMIYFSKIEEIFKNFN